MPPLGLVVVGSRRDGEVPKDGDCSSTLQFAKRQKTRATGSTGCNLFVIILSARALPPSRNDPPESQCKPPRVAAVDHGVRV